MFTGHYNTPIALGREPLTAAFWALCAPLLFPVVVMVLASSILPVASVLGAETPNSEQLRLFWLITCIGGALQFAALSFWSEHIGAGSFAGSMRTSANWLIAALILGPLFLIVPNVIANTIMAGQEDWQFASEVNKAVFARENWTFGYLVFGILIAPVVEEVTFRGVALGAIISRGGGPVLAAILSSAAFALIHLQYSLVAMAVVFVTGVGLAVLRLLSGSILVPVVAHIAANADVLMLQTLASSPS